MIPASFIPFFSISAGAAATLIGLLFVAVSVAPERTVGKGASLSRRSVAESAFTALLNAFLVSLIALIPTAPLSLGALAVTGGTLLGFARTLAQTIARWRKEPSFSPSRLLRRLLLPLGMLIVYGLEFWWGVGAYRVYHLSADACGELAMILIVLQALAIGRSWELLGAQSTSLLALIGGLDEPDEGNNADGKRDAAGAQGVAGSASQQERQTP
ncbi:MAG TPA: hypothetical protein VFQ25_12255 [Ktedonobacterales bacterium]|nr:hypothetical protein [Ktedonobacterales bacterium]